jgi:predicted protein tyrosine phosphatase
MEILVYSLDRVKKIINSIDKPFILISILSPGEENEIEINNKNFKELVSLRFHDLDKKLDIEYYRDLSGGEKSFVYFSDNDAKKIIDLVKRNLEKINLIVVHCEAGISRSAGVAAALSKIINNDDTFFFKKYIPNMLVYRKIIENY